MASRHVGMSRRGLRPGLLRLAAGAGAALLLLGTFALYGRPDLVLTIGQMMWTCFGAAAT
ncbi:MAG: hypothetical protein QM617_12315 [Comamonas sp.]